MNQIQMVKLVKQVQAKDEEAFTQLYNYYYQSIYYFALKLAHNEADAKDIVQDTFVQVKLSIDDLKEPKLFKVWLNRIAFSKATRLFSRNKYPTYDPNESWVLDKKSEETFVDPNIHMRFQSDADMIRHFVNCLPYDQKSVLVLMYFEHMNMNEIAQVMEIPMGTVKSRLYLGKQKLRAMIDDYERENQTKLTFHGVGFGSLIGSAFAFDAASFGIKALPKAHVLPFQSSVIFQSVIGKVAMISLSAVVSVGGGVGLYKAYTAQAPEVANADVLNNQNQKLYPFPDSIYKDTIYKRADDVYYTLLEFAHCEVEMKEKTQEELKQIQPLYKALKDYGSLYYDKLKQDHWDIAFEQAVIGG